MQLFKKCYLTELKKAKENAPGEEPKVTRITTKYRGHPLLLGEVGSDAQAYIRALRKAGVPISTPVILAATQGIITAHNRSLLAKFGGHIQLGRTWAVSIL